MAGVPMAVNRALLCLYLRLQCILLREESMKSWAPFGVEIAFHPTKTTLHR